MSASLVLAGQGLRREGQPGPRAPADSLLPWLRQRLRGSPAQEGRRVAVVGAGITGLGAALALRGSAQVSLFEQEMRLGGHANTVDVSLDGVRHGVDTGFLVANERTYPLLLALETGGTVILYWKGVILYQTVVASPATHQAQIGTLLWSIPAIVLIQIGSWICYLVRPALPPFTSTVLGHVVLFLSRMSFLLAAAIFSFVFIAPKAEFYMPAFRYGLVVAGLFSLFCYSLELERLGRGAIGKGPKVRPATNHSIMKWINRRELVEIQTHRLRVNQTFARGAEAKQFAFHTGLYPYNAPSVSAGQNGGNC